MIKDFVKRIYRFYYISLYNTTMYEIKTATEISIGYLVLSCLFTITSVVLFAVLKISAFWEIHIEKGTIITISIILLLLNTLIIRRLVVKYITKNIIDQPYIDTIEKDAKKYTESGIWLKFIYGNILVFLIMLLSSIFYVLPIMTCK